MTESLATFLPAVIWKVGNILHEIIGMAKNIPRQYFENPKCTFLTVDGMIKTDKLTEKRLGFFFFN